MSLKLIPLLLLAAVLAYLAMLSFLSRHTLIKPPDQRSLKSCPDSPNCVFSGAKDDRHRIDAFVLPDSERAKSWDRLIRAIQQSGGEIVVNDGKYCHAVFTSTLFRFRDDVEIVRAENEIAVRSASRAGRSDMGENRRRVENIRQRFLAGQ